MARPSSATTVRHPPTIPTTTSSPTTSIITSITSSSKKRTKATFTIMGTSTNHNNNHKGCRIVRSWLQICLAVGLVVFLVLNESMPEVAPSAVSSSLSSSPSPSSRATATSLEIGNLQQHQQQQQLKQEGLSSHARDVLLSAAKPQNQEQDQEKITADTTSTIHAPSSRLLELPPLESLVEPKTDHIIGDVQFLLDFAVVGFGKCGTTSLLHWLQQKNTTIETNGSLVRAPNYEAQFLRNERPSQLVRKMYQFAMEEREARQQGRLEAHERLFKAFKNPSDIRRPESRRLLAQYWPQTKLIVTVRHPVEWMVSLYNYFKIEKGRHAANLTARDIVAPGGRDHKGDTKHFVSSAKGEFHAMLAETGKTPLETPAEWALLQPWLNPSMTTRIRHRRLPNPIFVLEMNQLADTNTTRAQQFARDLEDFLGLPHHQLPPAVHVRPNTNRISKNKDVDKLERLKMDICKPEWAPVLEEMTAIARSASQWLREYFIQSPDVTVSSPDYFGELLERWMMDPCPHDQNDNENDFEANS